MRAMLLVATLLITACHSRTSRVAEANAFTSLCGQTRLAKWNVRASAAGDDCAVLLVETRSMILEDAMVEAMHHGSGAYDMFDGGLERYARQRSFRGVAYKDKSGRIWRYGKLTAKEALQPCR